MNQLALVRPSILTKVMKMKLGIISYDYYPTGLKWVKDLGLDYVEYCINENADKFLAEVPNLKNNLKEFDIKVASIGRWGTNRIDKNGLVEDELQISYRMIDACETLGSPVFVCGCNYVEELSYYDNLTLAIQYFKALIDYASPKGVKIAVYNCRWNNFICNDETWRIVLGHLPELGIKYDPSHCVYAGGNYLEEINQWGERIYHFHLKGSLYINNRRVDDPPAGLDMTNWKAVMGLLYAKGYNGVLSIEPHSNTWTGELGAKGIDYTINYFKQLIF